MRKYKFLAIAISFLAIVAGTAVADNSVFKPIQTGNTTEDNRCRQDLWNTGQYLDLNYVNGICTENPYPF